MMKLPFRAKTRREQVRAHAEQFVVRGRERAESVRHTLPDTRELLDEARTQAQSVLDRIEDLREQAQPAVDQGVTAARQAGADAALAVARAVAPKRSRSRGPLVVLSLLLVGGIVFFVLRRHREGLAGMGANVRDEESA